MADPQITQLSADLANLARAMREVVDASSRTAAAQNANRQSLLEQTIELDEFTKSLTQGRVLDKQQNKLVKEAIELKKKEQRAAKAYQKAAEDALKAEKSKKVSQQDAQKAAQNAAGALKLWRQAQNATNDAQTKLLGGTNGLSQGMGRLSGTTDKANWALAWFGATLRTQGDMLLAQNKASGGLVEGTNTLIGALTTQQDLALAYRLTGKELAAQTAKNRQLVNALGGTARSLSELDPTITKFRMITGDAAKGLELALESATSFAQKGIAPTQGVMARYTEDLRMLQMRTGKNAEQAVEFYESLASDVDTIDLLRSARKEEREAILANQRALVNQSLALGMSADQARDAAKMLNKMVAAKPLDRLKQAAKVRALSGAMGIAGGEEAAQAITAGKRATPEQKEALQRFSTSAANVMDQMAGQGLGSEIFATTLLDKLNLDDYYGKDSKFSTTLGDTFKPAITDLKSAYIDVTETQTGRVVDTLMGLYKKLELIVTGANWWGTLISGGIAAIAAFLYSGKIKDAVASTAGKLLDKGKGLLTTTGGAAGASVGTAANAAGGAGAAGAAGAGTAAASKAGLLSKIATVGKVAGVAGAGLDVGVGLSDLMDGKRQTEMPKGWEMLSPMRWGMYGGEKINQGAEALMGGQSIGSKMYDLIHGEDEVKKMLAPMPMKPKTAEAKHDAAIKKTADASDEIKVATMQSADRLSESVKRMDTSNDFLKKIAELAEQQVALNERQLVAMTMTEKERTTTAAKTALRRDTKFGSQYNYA